MNYRTPWKIPVRVQFSSPFIRVRKRGKLSSAVSLAINHAGKYLWWKSSQITIRVHEQMIHPLETRCTQMINSNRYILFMCQCNKTNTSSKQFVDVITSSGMIVDDVIKWGLVQVPLNVWYTICRLQIKLQPACIIEVTSGQTIHLNDVSLG